MEYFVIALNDEEKRLLSSGCRLKGSIKLNSNLVEFRRYNYTPNTEETQIVQVQQSRVRFSPECTTILIRLPQEGEESKRKEMLRENIDSILEIIDNV